ncbi:hypothetical protein EMIHUDRAFT_214820 [Emiliania huxleyi CCMP1516]|uniref:Glutathione peroxidase n=2 Tax=Emiliania huxleyi TaxID=2903 RepID=A0A0D3IJK0_EMIH1|nr:hypothetical protein EMIHUDRAFT_214820 [Emiliania huxleyi CCMP1516]EOD11435.1 hypothetical protein EMIHUDRAFT_214820 [Emiliania huxleyi CCMP1516]|eukprot:XP_005763864.1 hypothetical protein EMIHUDRAFT_214820 [Emiliania huxleyi CCMP1516]
MSLSLVTLTSAAALFGGKVAPTQRSGSAYSYAARSLVDNSVQELEQYRGPCQRRARDRAPLPRLRTALTTIVLTAIAALQSRLESRGFCVLAFPCNQFGGQEPGSASEILEFARGK